MEAPLPVRHIDGWTLDRRLGEGATAVVYAAHRTALRDAVGALKLTRDVASPTTAARVVHEARLLATVDHPSLPTLCDAGVWQGRPYVVTGLVPGLSLDLFVTWPPLPQERVARLLTDLAEAVARLHAAQVVHRDIKPANVRVAPDGRAVLLDFGAATAPDLTRLTIEGRAPATLAYAPPEWFDGAPVGRAGDLYALGVTLHELLTGDTAFGGGHLEALRDAKRIPLSGGTATIGALAAVVHRLTAADPTDRGTIDALVADLQPLAAPRAPVAPPGTLDRREATEAEPKHRPPGLRARPTEPTEPRLDGTFGGVTTWFGDGGGDDDGEAAAPEIGHTIGGFRIVDVVGRGGMGEVWLAEQAHPRRRVALKTVHPERVSAGALARFRFEVQALGQLLHPGIPQVYAAGEDHGRVFLAMELVDGRRLDEWAAEGASVAKRLRLLAEICDAVHHAHLRGILHRDLKPANILVDRAGQPKVLDFGIAQALDAPSARSQAGTPAYMSPEQRAGAPLDVRSDVYTLGVIGFELLCGERPAPGAALAARDRRLAGDPDAIVCRALALDPDDRYASAQELAADLRRHLTGRPVVARSWTWTYLAERWVRRNTAVVTVASAIGIGLAGVATTSAWSVATVTEAFETEQRLRAKAEAAREAEVEQRARADEQLAVAEAVTRFLGNVLEAAHPDQAVGLDVSVREAVAAAADQVLAGELLDQPAVDAAVRIRLARTLGGLGDDAAAQEIVAAAETIAARSPPSAPVAELLLQRADTLGRREPERALRLVDQAEADLATLDGVRPEIRGTPHFVRGRIFVRQQRYREAAAELRRVLDVEGLGGTELEATAHSQIANALYKLGAVEEARASYTRALAIDVATFGDDHPQVATGLGNIGAIDVQLGATEEGLSALERAVSMRRRFLAADHPRVGDALTDLCRGWVHAGRLEEAARCLDDLDAFPREARHQAHLRALVQLDSGDLPTATRSLEAVHEAARVGLGEERLTTLKARGLLALARAFAGDAEARAEVFAVRDALLARVEPRSPYAAEFIVRAERLEP
ncbi:MAG: serine/threonine protein kinase [Myxococcota bacterium]